jgi:hypothetical protein
VEISRVVRLSGKVFEFFYQIHTVETVHVNVVLTSVSEGQHQ